MVTVFYYIYYKVAGVVVTKGVGFARAGGMADASWRSFGNLLVQRNRITLEFSLFSQKYSVQNSSFQIFELVISKDSNPKGMAIMFQI